MFQIVSPKPNVSNRWTGNDFDLMYKTVLKMWMKQKLSAPLPELRRKGYLIEKWNRYLAYIVVIAEGMKNNEENNCFEHTCVLSFSLFVSLSFVCLSNIFYRLVQFYSHSSLKWMDRKKAAQFYHSFIKCKYEHKIFVM